MPKKLIEEALTRSVIGAFYEVHRDLGFGFLEHVYSVSLERELRARGHSVGLQVSVPVYYKGEIVTTQRIDMLVDEKLVLELKSTLELHSAWDRQLINYLRATTLEVGLLLHFGLEPKFIRRIFSNHLKPFSRHSASSAKIRGTTSTQVPPDSSHSSNDS